MYADSTQACSSPVVLDSRMRCAGYPTSTQGSGLRVLEDRYEAGGLIVARPRKAHADRDRRC